MSPGTTSPHGPGTGSNAVFAGHVTWNGRAVFSDLDNVTVGERISLSGGDGKELVYIVSDTYLVDPNDPTSISVMAATETDVITIITCSGTFYYTGDPVYGGEYTQRRIIRAALSRSGTSPFPPPAANPPTSCAYVLLWNCNAASVTPAITQCVLR